VEDKFFNHEKENGVLKKIIYPRFHVKKTLLLKKEWSEVKKNIKDKVQNRVEAGLLSEVESLQDLPDSKFTSLGLDYRLTHLYLRGFFTKKEWLEALARENIKYAKRQQTWMKRQKGVEVNSFEESCSVVSDLL
jgi:tRNA dimethylallyltransferase